MATDVVRVRLTQIVKSPVLDRAGEILGRVNDVIVRLGSAGYPPITGLRVQLSGRHVFVPINQVATLRHDQVQLTGQTVNLGRFERRPGEVLLYNDILAHKLINVEAGKLVRAADIIIENRDGIWHVVGIDNRARGLFQRTFRPRASYPIDDASVMDWSRVEPFVGHVPSAKLRLPLRRLQRLHPAQIADLVEAASHEEGEEIITAVHADPELEADVFEELDTEHQVEFLRQRSDIEAAAVLGTMAPDDAVDLIGDLQQSRRASILARLPAKQQAKIKRLLAYNPSTAGGLMTTDFLAFEESSSVAEVRQRVQESSGQVLAVYLVDAEGHLVGTAPITNVMRAGQEGRAVDCLDPIPVRVHEDADFTDIALLMADYNLTGLPVVDDENHLVGVISVDDVLEELIPDDWRRRQESSGR